MKADTKERLYPETELTPLKAEIESIFNKRNIDEDCDAIARLLSPYQKVVRSCIRKGFYEDAVLVLLEILESLTNHFVKDEHYCYFDDMYSPDYICQEMLENIIKAINAGTFPDNCLKQLEEGMKRLEKTEAWEEYGIPYALYVWQKFLKNR